MELGGGVGGGGLETREVEVGVGGVRGNMMLDARGYKC